MNMILVAIAAAAIFIQPVVGAVTAAGAEIRTERIEFARGATSASVKGQLRGYGDVDYQVRAGAGQTLSVKLKKTNSSNYFNILPPGSKDVAMYVGQTGEDFSGVLPTDGDYTIRVYLVRAAARRNEASRYTLTVSVTGKALAPLPASKDAVIPGTHFHASGKIACTTYLSKKPQECEVFVIRRGFDGTATVEIPQAQSVPRRILFVKGKPVASDSQFPMTVSRKGDITVVMFDNDERYEIPDVFIFGG